jgi:hypothetical protein
MGYFIDVTGLVLIEDEGNDAGVGHFFLLHDREQVVDGCSEVAIAVVGEGPPEHIERIRGLAV